MKNRLGGVIFYLTYLSVGSSFYPSQAAQVVETHLETSQAKEKQEFLELERLLLGGAPEAYSENTQPPKSKRAPSPPTEPAQPQKFPPRWWPFPKARVPIADRMSDAGAKMQPKLPFAKKIGFPPLLQEPPPPENVYLDPEKVYSIAECVTIAMQNHEPLRVAREQVELAEVKLSEARRHFFPNATLRTNITDGETRTAPFKEREYIFRIEQPLFDGGGLRASLAQAELNLEVAKENYQKILQDLRFEVEKNYYELAKVLGQDEIYKETVSTATPVLELVRRQFSKELVTRLELLHVQSLYQQLEYQVASLEKEVILARMNLQHTMTLPMDPPIQIESKLTFAPLGYELDDCQGLALKGRTEVLIDALLVEFHDYGRKFAEAKKKWKVDLSASYGASGSAFEGEELSLGDDWFVGLQVSRPVGLHTFTSSATHQRTSPKLGESDRTVSTAFSTELGLFNQFPQVSEEEELEVSYRQAVAELEKVKMTVESEVAEAYFNTQRASVLYDSQKQKVELREQGLAIADFQQKINEVLVSNVLDALIELTQERAASASALADYFVALISLNRATGYAL